jgi:DNA primase
LSRFLFDRQSEGLDLSLPENRGELRARCEPLLNRMPRSTLRDAMWHEMLRLCGNKRREWQPGGKQDGNKPWQGRRERIREERVGVRLSRDIQLCLALLEAPDMAQEIYERARSDRQLPRSADFAHWIMECGLGDRQAIIYRLATDPQARARFYNLFDGIEHIPAREHILASARELMAPDREATRKQRLASLLKNLSDLSEEELRELKAIGDRPEQ